MKIDVNEPVGANDDFHAFAHTQLAFATFHPHYRFEDCHVELYLHGPGRAGCRLSVGSEALGTVEVNALADDVYDVVERAAELLGEAVDRRIERADRASGPVPHLPLHSLAPAPRPASTSWADIG
ncbi:MAG: hypothetical protein NXI30_12850 [bacterium]|nr:hypothetical protein [bacterium]